eukprot:NODE_5283_length_1788_cov_3.361228.p1 GENE.NODE_5283_length_1788_cov_3.361228~~NODE_5283_length_1788_cov_3.361228.p1  ORF type:complete len:520 (-),score=177.14 NODE_5283_length_1788_cov_3.361228:73-1632(-)
MHIAALRREMQKHTLLLHEALTQVQQHTLQAFLEQPKDYFDAEPTFSQSYAPQSGQIFGILKQMKETFEANLSDSQKEEMAAAKAYEELKRAKLDQIRAGEEQIETKTGELADTNEAVAHDKQEIEDTKHALTADEQFLMMLKEKCQMTDAEWEDRQKVRRDELAAVSKAIEVLSTDDAHDLFTRTFNPASLVQERRTEGSVRRNQASEVLAAAAQKANNPRPAALAASVKLDAFTKVKAVIDELVTQLLKQKDDEIKLRDFCIGELHSSQLQVEEKNAEKGDLKDSIAGLEHKLEKMAQDVDTLETEIKNMEGEMKEAGDDREAQNAAFQAAVRDQRETQMLLKQALSALDHFYRNKASLAQQPKPAGPPPPPGFEKYEKNAAGAGVMGMIQQIINDAATLEKEVIRSEEEAQKAYEDFVTESKASIKANHNAITHLKQVIAKAEHDLLEGRSNLDEVMLELENLANARTETHQNCDFVMKNFEIRQAARVEEVEALRQAKAILSGSNFADVPPPNAR